MDKRWQAISVLLNRIYPWWDAAIYIPYFRNKFISRLKRWRGDEKKILRVTDSRRNPLLAYLRVRRDPSQTSAVSRST